MYPFPPGFSHSTFYLWNSSILLLIVLLHSFSWLCSVPSSEYSTIHLSILLLMGFWVVLYFVCWIQCGYEHSYMRTFLWRHICHVYLGVELLAHRRARVCSNLADVSMHISHNHMYPMGLCKPYKAYESPRGRSAGHWLSVYSLRLWEAVYAFKKSCKKNKSLTLVCFCCFL